MHRYTAKIRYPGSGFWTTGHATRRAAIDAAFAELDRWERAELHIGDTCGRGIARRIGEDRGWLASVTYRLAPSRSRLIVQTNFVTITRT